MFKKRKKLYLEYDKYSESSLFKLVLEDDLIPQGICWVSNYVFITCYTTSLNNSRVLMFDLEGNLIRVIILSNRSHVGGISYDRLHDLIFICDSFGSVSSYPYKEFINGNVENKTNYKVADSSLGGGVLLEDGKLVCSYLSCFEGKLYVGSFNKRCNGLVKVFDIKKENTDISLKYVSEFVVPRKIQGIEFYRTKDAVYMFLSKSYTRVRDSSLLIYKYEIDSCDYSCKTFTLTLPPMLEQIVIRNGKMLLLFESFAKKYRETAKVVVDSVVILDVEKILYDFLEWCYNRK